MRTFVLVSLGLYAYVQMLPSRESMKRPHTPSAARPSFDTVTKQGEDDPRPYMIRVFDYWIPGFEERQRTKMDEAAKEVDEARQANIFKTAVPFKVVRQADYLCVVSLSPGLSGSACSTPIDRPRSAVLTTCSPRPAASPTTRRLPALVNSPASRASRFGLLSTTSASA